MKSGTLILLFHPGNEDSHTLAVYLGHSRRLTSLGKILPILSTTKEDYHEENVKYLKQCVRSLCVPNDKVKIVEVLDRNHKILYDLNIFKMGWKLVEDFEVNDDENFFCDRFDLFLDRFIEIQIHNLNLFSSLSSSKITINEEKEIQTNASIFDKHKLKVLVESNTGLTEKNLVEFAPFQKIFEYGKNKESTVENRFVSSSEIIREKKTKQNSDISPEDKREKEIEETSHKSTEEYGKCHAFCQKLCECFQNLEKKNSEMVNPSLSILDISGSIELKSFSNLSFDLTGKIITKDHEIIPVTSWNVKSTLFRNDCKKCLCISHSKVKVLKE